MKYKEQSAKIENVLSVVSDLYDSEAKKRPNRSEKVSIAIHRSCLNLLNDLSEEHGLDPKYVKKIYTGRL